MNFIKFEKVHSISDIDRTCKNNLFEENVHNLIIKSMLLPNIYNSGRVQIFPLAGYNGLILKMGRKHFSKPDKIPKRLTLVPIKYENNIEDNPRFGVPLYHIDKSNSKLIKKGYVKPKEVIFIDNDNMAIVRHITGREVNSFYKNSLKQVFLHDSKDVNSTQMRIIMDILNKYGVDVAIKAMEYCKDGIHDIKKNQLGKGIPAYRFKNEQDFHMNYIFFKNRYLKSTEAFSSLPQETYDKAVKDILSAKDFVFDFTHPKNTFINFDTKEFMFIDVLCDDKYFKKNEGKNPIEQFRDVLLGYSHNEDYQPKDFIFYPDDKEKFDEYTGIIKQKLNNAAPDEYKITSNY